LPLTKKEFAIIARPIRNSFIRVNKNCLKYWIPITVMMISSGNVTEHCDKVGRSTKEGGA
jgi:hypothetical protein